VARRWIVTPSFAGSDPVVCPKVESYKSYADVFRLRGSRGAGQLSLRASTNSRMELAGLGIIPVFFTLWHALRGGGEEQYY
jgi:hypothetical protein